MFPRILVLFVFFIGTHAQECDIPVRAYTPDGPLTLNFESMQLSKHSVLFELII